MPLNPPRGRVLIVAGSDSGGGAGIQGDIKTVTTLGGYAATAITALTAQNTRGVFGVHEVPPAFVRQQMQLVLDDIGADAIKTGMLHSHDIIETVAEVIAAYPGAPLVLDPVMVAKGGAPLLQESALQTLRTRLLPLAQVLTPNLPEAELLCGFSIPDVAAMARAGETLLALGCGAVLLKGGHSQGDTITDMLLMRGPSGITQRLFHHSRIDTRHTHGTGCTLASAIATLLAQGIVLEAAVERALEYVQQAIKNAPGFGHGNGPLGHHYPLN